MIKATGKMQDGRPMLILGLSGENITRLMADEPISVNVGDLGADMPRLQVVLIAGRTEDEIAQQLEAVGLIGPDTRRDR